MSHLRHCPKHKKLLPCAHCALTHKPAPVAVAEPVPKSAPARSAPTPKPCGGCDQKRCRYCYPEKQEQTSHLTGRHTGKWNHAPCGDCGLVTCRYCHPENQTTPPDLTHKEIVARFGGIYLPGILGLSRVALTRLLNTPVGFRTEPDHNHPPQKILK